MDFFVVLLVSGVSRAILGPRNTLHFRIDVPKMWTPSGRPGLFGNRPVMFGIASYMVDHKLTPESGLISQTIRSLQQLPKEAGKLVCDFVDLDYTVIVLRSKVELGPDMTTIDIAKFLPERLIPDSIRKFYNIYAGRRKNYYRLFSRSCSDASYGDEKVIIVMFLNSEDLTEYILEDKVVPMLKSMGISLPKMVLLD